MIEFLSEENIDLHREYLRSIKLKYSILTSSIPSLLGADIKQVTRLKLNAKDRADVLLLLPEITMHEIYFSSYTDTRFSRSSLLREYYGSEASFLNEMYRICMSLKYGFVSVYIIGGIPRIRGFSNPLEAVKYADPILTVDIAEHTYFMDYGFDKERYLVSSLPYLDITKIKQADE